MVLSTTFALAQRHERRGRGELTIDSWQLKIDSWQLTVPQGGYINNDNVREAIVRAFRRDKNITQQLLRSHNATSAEK